MDQLGLSQKAIIFNEDKFLVIKRGDTAPSNPNKWDFPGGDVDFGEDLYDSIKREIEEETGLKIDVLEPYEVHSRITYDKNHWITIAYKCNTENSDIKLSYEHSEYKWVNLEEFNKLDAVDKIIMFAKKAYDK
jgi:8-oxo-dGTP diphosphatase